MNFFGPPTIKWQPYKCFVNLNGNHLLMANVFKIHIYQTFGLLKMHNISKIWFANNKFSLWKSLSKMLFFNFYLFNFSKFQVTFVKNLMKKPSFFIMDFEGSNEVLLPHKYFWSIYFLRWNDGPFKIFWNFHGNAFCYFIFSKWKLYSNLTFHDTFKI